VDLFPQATGRFTSVNIADARINGVEFSAGMHADWRHWFASLSGGLTYIDPQNLNAVAPENQLDLSPWPKGIIGLLNDIANPAIVDQPEILKYRTKWTVRGSASVGYKQLSLTSNFRYRSYMESIDQFLFLIVSDLNDFRQRHTNGDTVFDLILKYDVSDKSNISLNIDNAFNEEYLIIPGYLAEQRSFTLQYQFKF
jgi:outer membrane receptor protein involved in Fe transport